MQNFFIPVLFRDILNCPDEHLFKRNQLYRKRCNRSKLSGANLPAYSIIYAHMCICAYSGMIRLYVALVCHACQPATSDQRMMATEAKRRRRPAADPRPYQTGLYGAQSQRHNFARNPRTCAIRYAPLRFACTLCLRCASACACTRRFMPSLLHLRASYSQFSALKGLCKLTNYKK